MSCRNDRHAANRHWHESSRRRSTREQIPGSGTARSKRQAWIKIEQPGIKIRRAGLIHAACHRIGTVQFSDRRFLRRRICLRQHRNLVPATGACGDVAVGEKLFSLVQACLLVRPENLVAAPVREIYELRLAYFDDPSALVIEAGIMPGNYRIMICDLAQFFTGDDAARHHGVWVYCAPISRLYSGRAETGRQRVGGLNDYIIADQLSVRLAQPTDAYNASGHNRKKSDAAYENAADFTPTPPPSAPTSRMPHLISYGHYCPNAGKGGANTTLVAVAIPVRNCREKGKYLKYPADTYLRIARHASRVGKTLHKYSLLIICIRCDRRHRTNPFPFRDLARVRGCGYSVPNWESEVHRLRSPRVNIEGQWQPRK